MIKMYSVKHGKIVVEVMDKFIDIYMMNAKTDKRSRQKLLHKYGFYTEVVLKGGFILYCLAVAFYFINPLYSYFFRNEIVALIPLYFPYFDENTKAGFIGISVIHIIFFVVSVVGSACTDFMFIMIIVNVPFLSNIFKDNLSDVNEMLREEEVNILFVKAKLRNILLMHREICEYVCHLIITIC